jgi:hypothetical protein
MSVSGSIDATPKGTTSKSIAAGFKKAGKRHIMATSNSAE